MPSAEMWRCVGLVGSDVSEEHVASVIRVEGINKTGTNLAATSSQLITARGIIGALLSRGFLPP
jgi:hypothetical protein